MAVEHQHTQNQGYLALDVGREIPKEQRLEFTMAAANVQREINRGVRNLFGLYPSDPANALFWKGREDWPRGGWGSWSFAMPAKYDFADGAGLLPLEQPGVADADFIALRDAAGGAREPFRSFEWLRAGYGADTARMPLGVEAMVTSTTGHGAHVPVAAVANSPLIACHRDAPEFSRHVFDVTAGRLSVHGPLHSTWRVTQLPQGGAFAHKAQHVPALALGITQDNLGGGAFAAHPPLFGVFTQELSDQSGAAGVLGQVDFLARQLGGFLSYELGGPIHPGFGQDKHALGQAPDGTRWNPGHIWARALYYADAVRDAPLEFTNRLYPKALRRGGLQAPVWLVTDPDAAHDSFTGRKPGLWRWVAETIAEPPQQPPPGLFSDLVQNTTVINNNVVNINNIQNINNFNWWWQVIINILLNPGPGAPLDTAQTPYEFSAPSFHGRGIRRKGAQPYDGRFGGPPADSGGDTGPFGEPGRDTGLEDPGLRGSDAPGSDAGLPLPGAGGFPGGEEPFTNPSPGVPLSLEPGFRDYAETRRLREGIARQIAPHRQRPYGWTLHTICAVDNLGQPVATFRADDFYKDAATANAVGWFTPPEIIPDAQAAPRTTSAATFALYNGLWPDDNAACGAPAKLGFLTPDAATGGGRDGWYLTATGASGSVNAELRYLDAAAAPRAGRMDSYGDIGPGTDSTYFLGSATKKWAVTHTDALGALTAPADDVFTTRLRTFGQSLFYSGGGTAAPGISTSVDPDTGFEFVSGNKIWAVCGGTIVGAWLTTAALSSWYNRVGGSTGLSGYQRPVLNKFKDFTDRANSGAAETTLSTVTLTANELSTNGDSYTVEAHFSVTTSPVTIRLKYGGTTLATITTSATGELRVAARIIRVAASSQRAVVSVTGSATSTATAQYATAAIAETAAQTLLFTGQGTASAQVTQRLMAVNYDPV